MISGDEIPEVEEVKGVREAEETDHETLLLPTAASPSFPFCRINPHIA